MIAPQTYWREGDLAVCISSERDGLWQAANDASLIESGPDKEQVVRVDDVATLDFGAGLETALSFVEYPNGYYPAVHFRKITPDAEPADNAELIALICGQRVEVGA